MPTRPQPTPVVLPPSSSSSNNPLISPSMSSPTSPSSSTLSPTHRSFFDVISQHVRGRSRSRSPAPVRSPQASPPDTIMPNRNMSSVQAESSRPQLQGSRTFSEGTRVEPVRTNSSNGCVDKSNWDRMCVGRHSSEWLFKSQKTLKRQSMDKSMMNSSNTSL